MDFELLGSNVAGWKPTVAQLDRRVDGRQKFIIAWNQKDGLMYMLRIYNGFKEVVCINGLNAPADIPDGTFQGTCNTATNPGTPNADQWWTATEIGTYANFGGVQVTTLDNVLNYIKWTEATTTWSVITVPVPGADLINVAPTDNILHWDGAKYVPYEGKQSELLNYFYVNGEYPSPDDGGTLFFSGYLIVPHIVVMTNDSDINSTDIQPTSISFVRKKYIDINVRSIIQLTNDFLTIEATKDEGGYRYSFPIKIGCNNNDSVTVNQECIIIDDENKLFDIDMTNVKLSKGTPSKYYGLDENKLLVPMPDPLTVIKIINGDSIPMGLQPDTIIVESELIEGDYSLIPYEIIVPDGYYPFQFFLKNFRDDGMYLTATQNGNLFENIAFEAEATAMFNGFTGSSICANINVYGFGPVTQCKIAFKCQRMIFE